MSVRASPPQGTIGCFQSACAIALDLRCLSTRWGDDEAKKSKEEINFFCNSQVKIWAQS